MKGHTKIVAHDLIQSVASANLPCIPCSLQDKTGSIQDNQVVQGTQIQITFEQQLKPGNWVFILIYLCRHIYAEDSNKSFLPLSDNVEFITVLNCTTLAYKYFIHVFTEEVGDEPNQESIFLGTLEQKYTQNSIGYGRCT